VEGADTAQQRTPRATGWQRRLVRAAIAIVFVTLVLVPPFTPPVPWRWVTDRLPWQVVERVPWAYPTGPSRATAIVCGNDSIKFMQEGSRMGGPVILTAFGHDWVGGRSTGAGTELSGTLRLLDADHGVFTPGDGSQAVRLRRIRGHAACMA
jgi:hypothetical protein